jgi:hypothetical protein
MAKTPFTISALGHPKKITLHAVITKSEGTTTMMTMKDPVKWLRVSGVITVEEMRTAAVDTGTTIETRPVLASRHIGLDPREISINRQTRYLMGLAICTFTSTQKEKGNLTIS